MRGKVYKKEYEHKEVKVFSNGMVPMTKFLPAEVCAETGIKEMVKLSVLSEILAETEDNAERVEMIRARRDELVPSIRRTVP